MKKKAPRYLNDDLTNSKTKEKLSVTVDPDTSFPKINKSPEND